MNPPANKPVPGSPQEWLIHAESDLRMARLGEHDKTVLPQQVCFHAQQAAEKALKAVLLYARIDFPLTHDLQELLDLLEHDSINPPSEIQGAGSLTPYAVETRYPGYFAPITPLEMEEAINLAQKIIHWAKLYVGNS